MYPLKVGMKVKIKGTSTFVTIHAIFDDAAIPYIVDTQGRETSISNITPYFQNAYVLVHMPDDRDQGPGWANTMGPADDQVALINSPVSGYWTLTGLHGVDRYNYNYDERWLEPLTEAEYTAYKAQGAKTPGNRIPVGQFATVTPFTTEDKITSIMALFVGKKVEILKFKKFDDVYECRPQWTEDRVHIKADMLVYPPIDTKARFKITSDKGETPFVMDFTEAAQLYVELQPLKTNLVQVYP